MLGSRFNQHSFASVPDVQMARSSFDRSFTVKDTFDVDYLIPVFVDEVIPGDTMNLSVNSFARLSSYALKNPIMDNLYMDFFFFFAPNRLLMTNWEKLCGAQDNPGDSTDYILPTLAFPANGPEVGSIFDKFGLPTDIAAGYTLKNTLPLRAYNRIWNEWFRDENLQNRVIQNTDDGPDAPGDYTLLKRGKRHDYFTSCLPWPQKATAVDLPLGTSAPVIGNGKALGLTDGTNFNGLANFSASVGLGVRSGSLNANVGAAATGTDQLGNAISIGVSTNSANSGLIADLTSATSATINQLREAFMMQSLFELDARAGTRYVEILQAHFNVISPDFRLQRTEFLGSGSTRINSHPVAQTSPTSGSNALGQLGAFATSSTQNQNIGFTKSFVEHGYVIGLVCVRADITYQQGINRMWNRSTRYDFFWPKLQQLGEQAVLNKEIYLQGTSADENVFGYQERYAEYRYKPSEIHGEFRSQYATPLDSWHLAEEFGSLPALNSTFVQQSTPVERALAVTTGPDILADFWFNLKHARPMMTYAVPATLGRF